MNHQEEKNIKSKFQKYNGGSERRLIPPTEILPGYKQRPLVTRPARQISRVEFLSSFFYLRELLTSRGK